MTQQEEYKYIAEWFAYLRKENAGIFEVFFYDKEDISDSFVSKHLSWMAQFFEMPLPEVLAQSEKVAQIIIDNHSKEETPLVCYNWKMLQEKGINNKSAFLLVLSHELSHYYYLSRDFRHCHNKLWVKELACDYMAGAISALKGIAGGKYKYVVSQTEATITHPYGEIRKKCVEEAKLFVIVGGAGSQISVVVPQYAGDAELLIHPLRTLRSVIMRLSKRGALTG